MPVFSKFLNAGTESAKTIAMSIRIVSITILLFFAFVLSAQNSTNVSLYPHLKQELANIGLAEDEIGTLRLRHSYVSTISETRHFFLQQYFESIPVRHALLNLHLTKDGRLLHYTNNLVKGLTQTINTKTPNLKASRAILVAAKLLGLPSQTSPQLLSSHKSGRWEHLFAPSSISADNIPASLIYEKDETGALRLAWELVIHTIDQQHVWVMRIDAQDGQLLSKFDRVLHCQFTSHQDNMIPHQSGKADCLENTYCNLPPPSFQQTTSPPLLPGSYICFPRGLESPNFGSRSPQTAQAMASATASPYGWHDIDGDISTPEYCYTRGNHVYAYYDPSGVNSNPIPLPISRLGGEYVQGNVPQPDDCSLAFEYNNSISNLYGTAHLEDAITNLFVWNNLCHDFFYLYGFDEAAGNFQEVNPDGTGGVDGDYVWAEAQDGGGFNNANFMTPPDGSNPRMQMYLWNTDGTNSRPDGDFDNLIITHEYGHGVSFRLVGGPDNVDCLSNVEQGGEGWSDFFGLMLTMNDISGNGTIDSDVFGEGIRNIGTYVLNQPINGPGIRSGYYTNNMDCGSGFCNNLTYGDLPSLPVPHGVGYLWCTMLWDMTLALIDEYGFQSNIYQTSSTAGNVRAMKIVIEALKMTPCEPNFIQMRDAVLAANTALYGSAGQELIWEVFSRRGLGVSASPGGFEAFDNPTLRIVKTVDKETVEIGNSVTYTLAIKNNYSSTLTGVLVTDEVPSNISVSQISDDGYLSGNTINFPIGNLPVGEEVFRSFTGTITGTSGTTIEADYPVEDVLPEGFMPALTWLTVTDFPNPNSNSTRSWWHLDSPIFTNASLELMLNLEAGKNNHLSFWHAYDLEPGLDGGIVEIEVSPNNWVSLESNIIRGGYNLLLYDELITPIGVPIPFSTLSGQRAFSGYSNGYINTIVDLSEYTGNYKVRFRFASNTMNTTSNCVEGCSGWFIDDIQVLDLKQILNTACVTSLQGFSECDDIGRDGSVYYNEGVLPVEFLDFEAIPQQKDIRLKWSTVIEINNYGFEIQRKTADEQAFKPIGWVAADQSEDRIHRYQFTDETVETDLLYYYRLRQVDIDQTATFSKIVSAKISGNRQHDRIFPNPAFDYFTIQSPSPFSHSTRLQIYSSDGQLVNTYGVLRDHLDKLIIDCRDWAAGIYFVHLISPSKNWVQKIVISNR